MTDLDARMWTRIAELVARRTAKAKARAELAERRAHGLQARHQTKEKRS